MKLSKPVRTGQRRQGGQAIVMVALMMVALFAMSALAVDAGFDQADRRQLQAVADTASLAGAREYLLGQDSNSAHYVALLYASQELSFAMPGGCTRNACAAGTYASAPYSTTLRDSAAQVLDVSITHAAPSFFGRVIGVNTTNVGASARATPPGPQMTNAIYAVAAVSGNALINGGGAAYQTVYGPVYANGSYGANNGPHSTGTPGVQQNFDGTTCPGEPSNHIDNGGTGNNLQFTWNGGSGAQNYSIPPPRMFDSAAPTLATGAPTFTTTASAQDVSGNWNPGIYDGIFPSGGKMNPGVYKIVNVGGTISLGSITNTVYTPSGTEDTNGAVAIMLDSTDTGGLDITQAILNGLDDLHPMIYYGPRDPEKTHNFVIWGGNGAGGYKGGVSIGPGATTDMSGIIYLPQSAYVSNGNSSPSFTGSVFVATMTVNGGGNGQQVFKWVCGLNSVVGLATQGGLIR